MVGAGPAGAAAALVLARAGADVTLLDAGDGGSFPVGEGMPPAARPLLAALGLSESMLAQGHRPALGNRSAWGSARIVDTDFIAHPFGTGWHLDRRAFNAGLRAAARNPALNARRSRCQPVPNGCAMKSVSTMRALPHAERLPSAGR